MVPLLAGNERVFKKATSCFGKNFILIDRFSDDRES